MKKRYQKIIGFEKLLEKKLYLGVCGISFAGFLVILIINLINQMYIDIFISSMGLIVISTLYYLGRFHGLYYNRGIYLFFASIISCSYFFENGLSGPAPYFFTTILVFTLVYYPVKWHLRLTSLYILIFGIILTIGLLFPLLIHNPYKNQKDLAIDLAASVIVSLIFCFICIYFLRKNYEQERQKNLEQQLLLEKTHQQKSMFFINLSHEVKTPLTLIENYLDKYIAKKGEDEELLIIQQNIRKLRQDMIDYLSFENLERGSLSFESKNVINLTTFLEEKIKLFHPFAERKQLHIQQTIANNIFIEFNTQGLDQVLNNLLENAGKYTPDKGNIAIFLKKEKNSAILMVQNSGIEIQEEQLPHLFEPFYQLSHEKLNAQGIGMGLYTIKKILETTGASILVESNKDIGVKFSVKFQACAEKEITLQDKTPEPTHSFSNISKKVADGSFQTNRLTLLIVEDHADLLQYIRDELSSTYNVFVAENGIKAFEKLENIPLPNLIVSDIMMDKMDGYELLEKTLREPRFRHIPIIFLSAKGTNQEKISGLEKGAVDFISKPFSIDELKLKIRNNLDYQQKAIDLSVQELTVQFGKNKADNLAQKSAQILEQNTTHYKLTSREKDVLVQMKQGFKYEEIGVNLHISEHTVIRHVQNIYKKTNSTTKIDLLQKMYME